MFQLERIYMISMGSIVTRGALLQSHLLSTTTMKRLLLGICCMTKDLRQTQKCGLKERRQVFCVVTNYFKLCQTNTWRSPRSRCCLWSLWWCAQRQRRDILCHMEPSWFYREISELNVKQIKTVRQSEAQRARRAARSPKTVVMFMILTTSLSFVCLGSRLNNLDDWE